MSNFDNSLTRLPPKIFELTIIPYFRFTSSLLSDFLGHRTLDAITYNAEKAFISHCSCKDIDILREQLQYFRKDMSVFLEQIKTMRKILVRIDVIVKNNEQSDFLEKMSAHPICRKVLEDMGSRSMMIGGRMTIWKRLIGQESWRHEKLNTFFSNLSLYLKKTFASFHIPRNSELVLRGQVQDIFLEALTNPDFGKPELSAVDKVIQDIYKELAVEFLKNMPPAGTTSITKSA
jgi:hypothetical protein